MRRHLVTSDPAGLREHDHTAWCGDGPREFHRVAASVFSTAAERNQLMLLVSDQPRPEWLGFEHVDDLLERQALRLLAVDEAYARLDEPRTQRALFEATLEQALTDGYSGVTVVADNSRLVQGSDEEFASWLAWEAMADQLQATRPMLGVCYFDTHRIRGDRLAELAAMHPVHGDDFPPSSFRVFCDADALRVIGDLEGFYSDQVRRVVGAAVAVTGRELDISELAFIDHTSLLALDALARSGPVVRLRGARDIVHRLWALLDLPTPALEFC